MELIDGNILKLEKAHSKLVMLVITGVLDALCILLQGISLGSALQLLWQGAGTGSFETNTIINAAALFLLGYVARQIIVFGRGQSMSAWALEQSSELQKKLIEQSFSGGPAFVQKNGSGNITASIIEGTDLIENYLEIILPKVTDLIAIPVVLSIGLFVLDWISGIIALVMIPFIMLYMKMLGRGARESAQRQHGSYVRLGNHFMDTIRGIKTLAYFGRVDTASEEVFAVSERARKTSMDTIRVATLSSLALDLFRTFALAAIAIMLGFRLMDGSIGLLNALAVLIIVPEYFAAIRRFSTDFHASLDGKTQLCAVLDMLNEPTHVQNDTQNSVLDLTTIELDVQDLTYTYPNETQRVNSAIAQVNFSTGEARKIGIVGVSGSGKSTLARIIAGLTTPTSGCIKVNGKKIDLCEQQWRQSVAYIPQNPHIFHGSVRENIAFYCPQASEADILKAVHAAGLDDVVHSLPDGLNTIIGDGGRGLSGGQAQRIALARAFLDEKRTVIVFDEPTAHLDLETEYALKATMLPLFENRFVFFATHRLHWMRNMDVLLVLDEGRLVEIGSFDELISQNGALTKLVQQLGRGAVS